ncbi:excinuclease ABC subunit UvrB [Mycoplasma phocoenae]|uniref:UvrABC system protein B n=1 Tax=Mycoplasma phocoenae TaxID=754517 RepID=A0A858U2N2_9MOLU|nr:excinuclease ABC subunit UvrB [Mycoplasma phocoenae]QJG66730.1 excinuclease ABC subunit UvrB [Mycoplasma phocoenae]
MKNFKLYSKYKPAGDQPQAIEKITKKIENGEMFQVLKGVTGSGKTFTIANVIANVNRPVLVLSHNKTLASQLYSELKSFFPDNRVEYFVSYFDYYRPEAYIPTSDVYIDKTSQVNKDLDAMRLSAVNAILTRNDTIIVASVSAIYGALNPNQYEQSFLHLSINQEINQRDFLGQLILRNYTRNEAHLNMGNFSSKGDIVFVRPADDDTYILRIEFFDDFIEGIKKIDPITKEVITTLENAVIYPGDAYTVNKEIIKNACVEIESELRQRIQQFKKENKLLEAQRIEERTNNDIDSLKEFGICPGIENYSRFLDQRKPNERPYTLLDYFMKKNPVVFIDESHMMIPQLKAMYKGDRARKQTLVEYGFRLPSALDNRPLKFKEFEQEFNYQTVYISATPAEYELNQTYGELTRLFVRPTGLLDPIIEVRSEENQVEDIYDELQKQKQNNERTLILTTTKRMAEELTRYFLQKNQKIAYIHSEHNTFERNEILRKLRKGIYDAVIGINLLREGIDLPEVSLIIVLDANKESFFRSTNSLIQIVGRAARNENGRVIFYADSISKSMKETIEDNKNKRKLQIEFNKKHNITPKTIIKPIPEPIQGSQLKDAVSFYFKNTTNVLNTEYSKEETINNLRIQMNEAAKQLDYEKAIELRDLILELQSDNKK